MNKGILIVLSTIASAILAVYCGGGSRPSVASDQATVIVSPASTYTVELKGEIDDKPHPIASPAEGWNKEVVRFSVLRKGQPIITDEPFYSADSMDSRFIGRYPDHAWISDSALRFGDKKLFDKQQDSLYVMNTTKQPMLYLRIHTFNEEFLLFDLPPNMAVKIPLAWQPIKGVDYFGITGSGIFDGGTKLEQHYSQFDVRRRDGTPVTYCLSIEDDEVIVVSPELTGNKINPNTNTEEIIPVSKNCIPR